jgi:hypothetical protein
MHIDYLMANPECRSAVAVRALDERLRAERMTLDAALHVMAEAGQLQLVSAESLMEEQVTAGYWRLIRTRPRALEWTRARHELEEMRRQ